MPGNASVSPVPIFNEEKKKEKSVIWLNSVLQCFWMYLADDEIENMHREAVLLVLENPFREHVDSEIFENCREKRQEILQTLFRGKRPAFVTEFKNTCNQIVDEMRSRGQDRISWSFFKKQYPSLSSRYTPELLELLERGSITSHKLASVNQVSPFDIYFSIWTGSQRAFDQPQLVFSIRNIAIHQNFKKRGNVFSYISEKLRRVAALPFHPGTANTIGWLRVYIDDENKLCFVDEVQSDTLEVARESSDEASSEYVKQCSDWNIHGFASICRWANDIGYRAAIHSRETAAAKEGMTESERKWNNYYGSIIKRFELRRESAKGYPDDIWVEGGADGDYDRKQVK